MISLRGKYCSCSLAADVVRVEGVYYRYIGHKRRKITEPLTVPVSRVLRVGETTTYSRAMLAIPMTVGLLALLIRGIPVLGVLFPVIPDVYYIGPVLWRLPHQIETWCLLGILCLLTIPLYLLSYRRDMEINTTQGRFLLPRKGMKKSDISTFQQAFTASKYSP